MKNVIKTVFLEFLINNPTNIPVIVDSIELINENKKLQYYSDDAKKLSGMNIKSDTIKNRYNNIDINI